MEGWPLRLLQLLLPAHLLEHLVLLLLSARTGHGPRGTERPRRADHSPAGPEHLLPCGLHCGRDIRRGSCDVRDLPHGKKLVRAAPTRRADSRIMYTLTLARGFHIPK